MIWKSKLIYRKKNIEEGKLYPKNNISIIPYLNSGQNSGTF